MTHELKTWPEFFQEVVCGAKPAELRRDDRNYQIGDELLLREWCPTLQQYTGHTCRCRVTYVLRDFAGLEKGYAMLAISLPPDAHRFEAVVQAEKA